MKKITITLFFIFLVFYGKTQNDTSTFELGKIFVNAYSPEKNSFDLNKFFVKTTINDFFTITPSAYLINSGSRNEFSASIKGFSSVQINFYYDGIPISFPYDKNIDLSVILPSDIKQIEIVSNANSLDYGFNNLGGAINLISDMPKNKIEILGNVGLIDTLGEKISFKIGSKTKKFFISASYNYINERAFRLSKDFDSVKYENGGLRDFSTRKSNKITTKFGYTPNKNEEYVFNLVYIKQSKDVPLYCGNDEQNSLFSKPRYWKWPLIENLLIGLYTKNQLSQKNVLKTKFSYTKFFNLLKSFDDATFTTQNKPYAFDSYYNDFAINTNIRDAWSWNNNNTLISDINAKLENHLEYNKGESPRNFKELLISANIQNVFSYNNLNVSPVISVFLQKNILAQDFIKTQDSVFSFPSVKAQPSINYQLNFSYFLKNNHFSLTLSQKTRFATLKERFSYRLGKSVPNPYLKPEKSFNIDFSYKFAFSSLNFYLNPFYSKLTDVIMIVDNAVNNKSQTQNAGIAEFYGLITSLELNHKIFNFLVNYSFISRKNLSHPQLLFTDVPRERIAFVSNINAFQNISFFNEVVYSSSIYSTSYGTSVPSFYVWNSGVSLSIKCFEIQFGINNVLDRNYSYTEGYPMPGRNFFAEIILKIAK